MHLSGPPKDAEPVGNTPQVAPISLDVRSRILQFAATARMLGKAEMICEIDPDADPSVRLEFDRRLQEAREELETFIMNGGSSEAITLPPDLIPAIAAIQQPVRRPVQKAIEAPKYSDWDAERPRFGSVPAVMVVLVVLGLFAHWAYGGSFGASDTFQYYVARERCLAVSDALLDLRNGRPQRLAGDLASLQREESDCATRNLYTPAWK